MSTELPLTNVSANTADNAPEVIAACWPAPPTVHAVVTTRRSGLSVAPYNSFNVATHVEDQLEQVAANRLQLQQRLGLDQNAIQWLDQVHGIDVADVESEPGAVSQRADALYSETAGQACAVMTADCLPVFFCNREGTKVAVAHAGWRGLAAGILPETAARFKAPAEELMVWLGPAISQRYFETGPEVKEAFAGLQTTNERAYAEAFKPSRLISGHHYTDLYALARLSLAAIGIFSVYGGDYCTYRERDKFYSYRRDGITGRMASIIFIDDPEGRKAFG